MRRTDDGRDAGEAIAERGVFLMPHRTKSGNQWLYAATGGPDGQIVEWLDFGGETGRTQDDAEDWLWRHLDRVDPVPALSLVRERPTLADYPAGTLERAAIAFLLDA